MIDAVVPCLAGFLLIAIVTLKQTDRFLVAYAYHNLTLFTIFAAGTVGTQQVDVVLGIGNTHRTGFRCHPREGAEGHGGLGLTEAFHHTDTGLLVEFIVNSWV